jgi:excisionase family DNA binding protein
MMDDPQAMLTVKEAAYRLSVTKRTIWQWISDGRLPAKRIGKWIRIHPDSLASMMRDYEAR